MKPHLGKNDKNMFFKYLKKSKIYFEYGSGGSTYKASLKKNIEKIFSVESDLLWHNKLKKQIDNTNNKIRFIYNEMDARPNTWGRPGPNSTSDQWKNYSDHINNLNETEKKELDLVMIDGRFRVACCLKCFGVISNDCVIAFDDFLNRKHYHIVLDYYDIIEQTIDNRMVILKKKKNIEIIPKVLIELYESTYL